MEGIKKRSLKSYELFLYFVFLAGKKIRPDLRCRTKKIKDYSARLIRLGLECL